MELETNTTQAYLHSGYGGMALKNKFYGGELSVRSIGMGCIGFQMGSPPLMLKCMQKQSEAYGPCSMKIQVLMWEMEDHLVQMTGLGRGL